MSALGLLLAFLFAQDPEVTEQVSAVEPVLADEAPTPDHAILGETLAALAERHPDYLRVEQLGTSRSGRPLLLAVLTDHRTGDADAKPAVFACGDLHAPTPEDARTYSRAALFAIESLLAAVGSDPVLAARLQRTTFYVMPAPHPDEELGDGKVAVRLDRNFPVGWEPWSDGSQGPYPLSEPESRALAGFLLGRHGLARVCVLGAAVEEEVVVGGGLPAFCEGLLDTHCERLSVLGTPQEGETLASLYERTLMRSLRAVLEDVPLLEIGTPRVERLRVALWQVEIPLAYGSSGGLDSREWRYPATPVRMRSTGGELVVLAIRRGGLDQVFEAYPQALDEVSLEELPEGAEWTLRLVVAAPEATRLELNFTAPRSGSTGIAVDLAVE